MPWNTYPNPMAAMYHIANGEKPPLPDDVMAKISDECKSFIFDCCCCPNAKARKPVRFLLQHPWLQQCKDQTSVNGDGMEGVMLPGPISPIGHSARREKEGGGPAAPDGKVPAAAAEPAVTKATTKKDKKKKKTRKLPKTPPGPGDTDFASNVAADDSASAANAAPPTIPKRPNKKGAADHDQAVEQRQPHQQQEHQAHPRPLPDPEKQAEVTAERRPSNRGSKNEWDGTTASSSSSGSGKKSSSYSRPTLQQQQDELRKMMEDQSKKIWKKQQEIDAQTEFVNAARLKQQQQQQQLLLQQQDQQMVSQVPSQPHPNKNSPRQAKLRIKTSRIVSYSDGMQSASPSPRWTNSPTPRESEESIRRESEGNIRRSSLRIITDHAGGTARPTGASAGLFVNESDNLYAGLKQSSASLARQQAMQELTRNEFAGGRQYRKNPNRNAISAGVGNACVTPQAGLSRQLPPLQQLREHQVMDGQNGSTRMAVPILPLRQIASAPTAILQPVIEMINAQKTSNRLIAPLGSSPGDIHEAERIERKRRKERRREKQRLVEERMHR